VTACPTTRVDGWLRTLAAAPSTTCAEKGPASGRNAKILVAGRMGRRGRLEGVDWLTGPVTVSSGTRSLQLTTVVLGLGVGWLLVAIQQYVWDGGTGGRLPYVPNAWYGTYQVVYERVGASRGLSAYYFWGRFALLIYLAVFVGVSALPPGGRRTSRLSRRVLRIAVVVGLIGDVLAYWGGKGDELSTLTGIGFGLVETPALLVLVLAMVVYGIGLARERFKPPLVAWSLVAGGTLSIPMASFVVTYIPHGILLTILAALAVALTGLSIPSARAPRSNPYI
jgi:hypothetical protein